jgi:hypothetical protein
MDCGCRHAVPAFLAGSEDNTRLDGINPFLQNERVGYLLEMEYK